MQNRKLCFIGAGNMPRSIISGLVKNHYPTSFITASNPSTPKLDALRADFGINVTQSNVDGANASDVIVLSVKPQLMEAMCADLIKHVDLTGKLVISIAAGITTARLSEMLGGHTNIVRTMPNTPSALGLGMTGLFAEQTITAPDREFAGDMMKQIGEILWVKHEDDINTVIAAAGSSPAYFFLFAQAMQDEAMAMGLNKDDARLLVQHAMIGSAQMIANNPDLELSELRAQVTSKGGTTFAAIECFKSHGLDKIVSNSMQAAVTRAASMAKEF